MPTRIQVWLLALISYAAGGVITHLDQGISMVLGGIAGVVMVISANRIAAGATR